MNIICGEDIAFQDFFLIFWGLPAPPFGRRVPLRYGFAVRSYLRVCFAAASVRRASRVALRIASPLNLRFYCTSHFFSICTYIGFWCEIDTSICATRRAEGAQARGKALAFREAHSSGRAVLERPRSSPEGHSPTRSAIKNSCTILWCSCFFMQRSGSPKYPL
jgi:hypothetical protein